MEPVSLLATVDPTLFRGIERLMIVGGGIFFAFLGYRLYRFGLTDGLSKITLQSRIGRLALSGVGPGMLFMALGASVLLAMAFQGAQNQTTSTTIYPANQLAPTNANDGSGKTQEDRASYQPMGTAQPSYGYSDAVIAVTNDIKKNYDPVVTVPRAEPAKIKDPEIRAQ